MIWLILIYIITVIVSWFLGRSNCKYFNNVDILDILIIFTPVANIVTTFVSYMQIKGDSVNYKKFFRL